MVLPNFLIVGTMKSGTTTLGDYLAEHDDVFVPSHEVHYFDNAQNYARGFAWYEKNFVGAERCLSIGEKSPSYSYDPKVPERIRRDLPGVKLIWIFREPVARAYSNYWHAVTRGNENLDFASAVTREPDRIARDIYRGYVERSIYVKQVKRYLSHFPREAMLFLLFEDLVKKTKPTLERTFDFLGVSRKFELTPDQKKSNVTYRPRSRRLEWLARRAFGDGLPYRVIHRINRSEKVYPPIDDQTKAQLRDRLRPHNRELAELTGLDLSAWER
jgi:hypothetical protein